MKIKVAELEGAKLDAWVARADNQEPYIEDYDKYGCQCWIRGSDYNPDAPYSPSSDWSWGGPIIEREKILLEPVETWRAHIYTGDPVGNYATSKEGKTPLIAAMRCFIASRFGEEVEE